MKVRTLREFHDLQSKRIRKPGETFEVSVKRAEELTSARNGTLVEVVEEEKKEVPKKSTKKK